MKLGETIFWHCASLSLKRNFGDKPSRNAHRVFRGNFGVTPSVWAVVWNVLRGLTPPSATPTHMLWALMFPKTYNTEHVCATIAGVTEKTFRQRVWCFIELFSMLPLITEDERVGSLSSEGAFVSIDGTDVAIQEPKPFDRMWYSFKLNGPGLRYQIGIRIESGDIVWIHGPFPCGQCSDLVVFRERLRNCLNTDETVIGDRGYRDDKCINPYSQQLAHAKLHGVIRARHETLNRRLKYFAILRNRFRHSLDVHGMVFFAITNLTQAHLRTINPLFDV